MLQNTVKKNKQTNEKSYIFERILNSLMDYLTSLSFY